MNLQALQRFLPLAAFLKADAGTLTKENLQTIAEALAGPNASTFVPLLTALRDAAPNAKGLEILATPEAGKLYEKLQRETEEVNRTIFCQCPNCDFKYEDEIRT